MLGSCWKSSPLAFKFLGISMKRIGKIIETLRPGRASFLFVLMGLPQSAVPAEVVVEDSPVPRRTPAVMENALSGRSGSIPSFLVTATSVRPQIDGTLDDFCWQMAQSTESFTQVDPQEGAPPTERTELRVLQDQDYLYIGVRCFDRDAKRIVAAQMQNDSDVSTDDTISLVFDTFGNQRDGYLFMLTPRGAKLDALLGPEGVRAEWDAIWEGASRMDNEGWTAEFAIPFKSLSFGPAGSPWGFNLERVIRRKREAVRWASPFKNKSVQSLADAGRLEGLSDIRKGIGIDVQPFLVGRYRDGADGSDDGYNLEPGFDAFVRLGPGVTAALTVNTDFAETEVDERRINLTRFPLFFPEKRDFFLQDAGIFSFGAGNAPLPFHSRRIGLGPSGETIDIIAGGKVTGRADNLSFGLLDVQVADGAGVPEKNLSVARLVQSFEGGSDMGGILTYGDPTSAGDNFLIGTDFNYRNTTFQGNNVLTMHGWVMASRSNGLGGESPVPDSEDGLAFGGAVVYPNEPVQFDLYAAQIDESFNPALGFVKRRGIREYGGSLRYRWRPDGWLRTIDLEGQSYLVTNLDNEVETAIWTAPTITLMNQPGDSLTVGFISEREQLFDPFEIQQGIVIPVGDYSFNRVSATAASSSGRKLGISSTVSTGEFYDGTRFEYGADVEWRASPHLLLAAGMEFNEVELPDGDFDANVAYGKLNITFSPRLSWNNIVQYDNISDTLGLNSRIRWIIKPGSDLFLVFNRGFSVEDGRFQSLNSEIATKLGWTFRY